MIQTSLSPQVNNAPETEPGYGQLFGVLIRRFPWFFLVFMASVGAGYYIFRKTPPTYQSSLQLLVEPNYKGKAQGNDAQGEVFTDTNVEIDTATQLELMGSSKLLKKAVDQLKPIYPEITVSDLKNSLSLQQVRTPEDDVATKIFKVEYKGRSPEETELVLKTMERVYLNYNEQQQDDRLRKGLKLIREQKIKVTEDLNAVENRLLRFRKSQNLTDPAVQAKAAEDALNNIQQERRTTANQYKEAQARKESLEKQLKRDPENALVSSRLSQSSRYQALLNEIQKTELAIAQESLRFTPEHPDVVKLQEELDRKKGLLQTEVSRALGGNDIDANSSEKNILDKGQLGQIDLNLASQLVETQTNMMALAARDQSLREKEQLLINEKNRYPDLLAQYNRLQPQIERNRDRLQQLFKVEQELEQELDKGGFSWEVLEEPEQGKRLGPDLKQNLLLGGVVGLMLGGLTAFAREASDDAVRTTAELEKQFALPLLGSTPKLPIANTPESIIKLPFGRPKYLSPWTIEVLQSSPRWESLDLIYKNIELLNSVSRFKSLMITSPLADEGKSRMAFGLAMSAARLHKRVLLIDANLRDPSLHQQLNIPNEQGLSTLLASEMNLPNQIINLQSTGSSYIDILTSGPVPADPANLLSSPRMAELISSFEASYDLVLLDASPVLGLVDALLTASSCGGAVMIASMGRVTRNQLNQATSILGKLNLMGVVANGASDSSYNYVPHVKQQRLALKQAVEK